MKKTTTPVATPTAEPPKPSPDVTIDRDRAEVLGKWFPTRTEKPKAKLEEPPPVPAPVAPPAPAAPVEPTAPAPKAPTVDMSEVVRKAVRDEIKLNQPTTPMPPPEPPVDDHDKRVTKLGLKYTEKRTLEGADWLAKHDPHYKGKDLKEDLLKFWEAEAAYQSNWEKKHKGEKWNPADEEHAEFYAREPEIDEAALEEAKDNALEERVSRRASESATKESEKNLAPKLQRIAEMELKEREQKLLPVIQESTEKAIIDMIELADPEIGKMLEVDGKRSINPQVVEKVKAVHPEVFALLNQEAFLLKHTIAEMEKFANLGHDYKPNFDAIIVDGSNKPVLRDDKPVHVHQEIVDFALAKEDQYAAQPVETSNWDGRQFIRIGDLMARQQAIQDSKMIDKNKKIALDELAEKYWSLDVQMLKNLYTSHIGRSIRRKLDFARKLVGANGRPNTPLQPTPQIPATLAPTRPVVRAPSSASSVDRIPSSLAGAAAATNQEKEVSSIAFPRG